MKSGKNGMELDLLNPGGWLCSGHQRPSHYCVENVATTQGVSVFLTGLKSYYLCPLWPHL